LNIHHHTLMCPSINPKGRLSRVYTPKALRVGDALTLEEGPSKHLLTVLRHQVGDSVIVFNGDGAEYIGQIQPGPGPKACVVSLEEQTIPQVESPLHTHLIQAIGRGERMDWVVQKATELGVARITPVFTQRTGVKLDGKRQAQRQARWQAIAIGACEQSGRVRVPTIDAPMELSQFSQAVQMPCFYLDPMAETHLSTVEKTTQLALIIGPEGGLDPSEIEALKNRGAQGLRLGPRVLRTETAGPVALACLQTLMGDMG